MAVIAGRLPCWIGAILRHKGSGVAPGVELAAEEALERALALARGAIRAS